LKVKISNSGNCGQVGRLSHYWPAAYFGCWATVTTLQFEIIEVG